MTIAISLDDSLAAATFEGAVFCLESKQGWARWVGWTEPCLARPKFLRFSPADSISSEFSPNEGPFPWMERAIFRRERRWKGTLKCFRLKFRTKTLARQYIDKVIETFTKNCLHVFTVILFVQKRGTKVQLIYLQLWRLPWVEVQVNFKGHSSLKVNLKQWLSYCDVVHLADVLVVD